MRYTLTVYDFAPGGRDAGHTLRNLSLPKAQRLAARHARRGFKRFGGVGACQRSEAAHLLATAAEARRQGDKAMARGRVELARILRQSDGWAGVRPAPRGGVRLHNCGADGGRFAEAYRSAVIRLA